MKKMSGFHKALFIIAIFSIGIVTVLDIATAEQVDILAILLASLIIFCSLTAIYICIKLLIVQELELKRRREKRDKHRRY